MADVTQVLIPGNLPASLPVMPLRRGVLLPGTAGPFVVGRERSLSAVQAAKDGFVLVAEAIDHYLSGDRFQDRLSQASAEQRSKISQTDEAARRQKEAIAKLAGE